MYFYISMIIHEQVSSSVNPLIVLYMIQIESLNKLEVYKRNNFWRNYAKKRYLFKWKTKHKIKILNLKLQTNNFY